MAAGTPTSIVRRCPLMLLLVAVALAAAAPMVAAKAPATSSTTEEITANTSTPSSASVSRSSIPPPPPPPCMNDMMTCASVYQDRSMLEPCCAGVKKVMKSDLACLCDMIDQAMEGLKQSGALNDSTVAAAMDGSEMFRQCGLPADSCHAGKGVSGKTGNSAPTARSIGGGFQILLLFALFLL